MIDQINAVGEQWFQWQWAMLWQSAVLIVMVAAVDRIIQKWAWPQLRYALWLLVLVKLILPPTLSSPVSVTSAIPRWADKVQVVQVAPLKTELITPVQEISPQILAVSETGGVGPAPTVPASVPVPEHSVIVKTPLSWKAYTMLTWFLGAAALALGLAFRLKHLRNEHLMDGSHQVPDWFQEAVEAAGQEIGCHRLPRVALSRHVLCPAVFGLFRPVLLVPKDQLAHMSPTDARHILLHELAHIKRLDLWGHGLYMCLLMVYWFNPLLWLMRRHLQNLRELCCDATVARTLREQTPAYRETLLETAKSLLAQPVDPGLGLLGLFENSTWLVTRLQWLEKETWRFQRVRIVTVSLLVVGMLRCVLPMAMAAKPTPDQAPVEADAIGYKATVNGNVLVELLGICDYPSQAETWWNPEGQAMDPGTIKDPQWHTEMNPSNRQQSKILAFQIGTQESVDAGITWRLPGSEISTHIPSYTNREAGLLSNVQYLVANYLKDKAVADLALGIALGNWQSAASTDGRREGATMDSLTDRDVRLTKAHTENGKTHMTIMHLLGHNYDCRIVAIDSEGTKHRAASNSNSGGNQMRECTATFDMALDDIKYFELQARPYTWIQFSDIALVAHANESEIHPNVQQAEAMMAPLYGLFESAYEALLDENDTAKTLAILNTAMPQLDLFQAKVTGTDLEQGVTMAVDMVRQMKKALEAGEVDKAKALMNAINAAGPQLEEMIREAAKQEKAMPVAQSLSQAPAEADRVSENSKHPSDFQKGQSPAQSSVVYVTGSTNGTGAVLMPKGRSMRLTELIANVRGVRNHSASHRVEIIRRINEGKEIIIRRDLNKISAGSETDPQLQPNDLINVILVPSDVLKLAEPQYEWWLAKPAKQITVKPGEPLTIEWSIEKDLYDKLEFLAVGMVPEGVDVSENERYQWLANDIPITVRKTLYGKAWPVTYALMEKPNKEAEPLTPGNYRIVVYGFKSGGGEGVGEWRSILNNNLICVAVAQLTVESEFRPEISGEISPDRVLEIRNMYNDRMAREANEDFIGFTGIQGNAVSRQGSGVHVTQDKTTIGQHTTNGTIAMLTSDFLEIRDLLKGQVSLIKVRD